MQCKYKVVMFDLDGTLSDSANGVESCLRFALEQMNMPVPDLSNRSIYLGPPLFGTFKNYCGLNDNDCDKAITLYKKHYQEYGILQNKLYDGLTELLQAIKQSGAKAVVATSKYEPFAKRIIHNMELDNLFFAVCGAEGERKAKADVIRYVLNKVDCNANDSVLIGDTVFDIVGANNAGCNFIGVTYGYGDIAQMKKQGATTFANDADDLINLLFDKKQM